jgi:hypothetical protein
VPAQARWSARGQESRNAARPPATAVRLGTLSRTCGPSPSGERSMLTEGARAQPLDSSTG